MFCFDDSSAKENNILCFIRENPRLMLYRLFPRPQRKIDLKGFAFTALSAFPAFADYNRNTNTQQIKD